VHLSIFVSVINQLNAQNFCFTISLFHASTCFEHMSWSSGGQNCTGVHETATYGCDDTRGCIMQFWPPDDQHMCSKHVEAWNKLIVNQKFCASCWLIIAINIINTFYLASFLLFTLYFIVSSGQQCLADIKVFFFITDKRRGSLFTTFHTRVLKRSSTDGVIRLSFACIRVSSNSVTKQLYCSV